MKFPHFNLVKIREKEYSLKNPASKEKEDLLQNFDPKHKIFWNALNVEYKEPGHKQHWTQSKNNSGLFPFALGNQYKPQDNPHPKDKQESCRWWKTHSRETETRI
ncbi:hypothetical protein chiPu_0007349 [Chiloscyllium punctatum]|uniref:Uncharacterized protein n=1 Tax=Chiloscyllium punctatum TaxID=137246 RepID=A0A401SET8_CHIPU|nr:hypothetical protein [Chiloscyllium punctatum]